LSGDAHAHSASQAPELAQRVFRPAAEPLEVVGVALAEPVVRSGFHEEAAFAEIELELAIELVEAGTRVASRSQSLGGVPS